MKKITKFNLLLFTGLVVLTGLYSCQKTNYASPGDISAATIAASGAIQLAAPATTTVTVLTPTGIITVPTLTSGIYIVNSYPLGSKPDSVGIASLPDTVAKYLTANYAGYTPQKAYRIVTGTGVSKGYVLVIGFNGKPVGLKFDADGYFVAVLEQREGDDLLGKGWHQGGCFANRDGLHIDTLAVSTLPTAIKAYFATNYPADTLLHAEVNFDATYIVVSADKGLFATTFTSGGTFIKRVQIYPQANRYANIAQSALPAAIDSYLTATFSGFVSDKALAEYRHNVLEGYFVFINASNTRLSVQFDTGGNFVKTVVLR